jgi:hypothetical protein
MWGITPPPAIVPLMSVSSSSSPLMASCKCRGVIRFTCERKEHKHQQMHRIARFLKKKLFRGTERASQVQRKLELLFDNKLKAGSTLEQPASADTVLADHRTQSGGKTPSSQLAAQNNEALDWSPSAC